VLEGGDALLPPVRHSVLAAAAPPYDVLQTELLSACTDDFAPALARVAEAIASSTRVMCMPACVADTDPEAPGWQVECSVEVEVPALGGGVEDFSLPPCDVGTSGDASIPAGEPACFATRTGAALREQCADEGYNLEFDVLWAGHKPQGATFLPRCELSDDKAVDCPDL
jgi:hypothetical protein